LWRDDIDRAPDIRQADTAGICVSLDSVTAWGRLASITSSGKLTHLDHEVLVAGEPTGIGMP